MTDVRTLLHDLAADAPHGHGEDTADRVVDLHRAQDRRRLRWAGVAAAVAVVVAVTPVALDRLGADGAATAAAPARATSLLDVPTRGSLAGDATAVAAAGAASWDDGIPGNDAGDILAPALADRHVAFVGQVTGGQVWALVVGSTGPQLAYAWFVDVDPGGAFDLQLAVPPERTAAGLPVALLDTAGDQGALVVVALPDQGIVLSAGQEAVVGSFEAQDGVALADVTTTGPDLTTPGYQLTGPGSDVARRLTTFDSSGPLGTFSAVPAVPEVDQADAPAFVACMAGGGWQVYPLSGGILSSDVALSPQERSEFDAAAQACLAGIAADD